MDVFREEKGGRRGRNEGEEDVRGRGVKGEGKGEAGGEGGGEGRQ